MDMRRQLYAGNYKIFRQLPSALKLCAYFKDSILPRYSDDHMHRNDALDSATIVEMCKSFEDIECVAVQLWKDIIMEAEVHGNKEDILWDRIRLRVQQSGDAMDDVADVKFNAGRFSSTLEMHRDTWANNVQQQLNWWSPLTPITAGRTIALYPSYFDVPVANTSNEWSMHHVRSNRKKNIPYPQLPVVQYSSLSALEREQIDNDQIPIVINPGDVLVFSGAHLHGSVRNTTGLTRFSTEVRTVDRGDLDTGAGAVNVDGKCVDYNLSWFKPIESEK
jgi:hypothetical protein